MKGLQVAPAELEDVLRGLDGVADVAVSVIVIAIIAMHCHPHHVCLFVHTYPWLSTPLSYIFTALFRDTPLAYLVRPCYHHHHHHHHHLQCSPQVIGIPDERSGQVPRAYIVREESLTEKQVGVM